MTDDTCWQPPPDALVTEILEATTSVAVVGVSDSPARPSNQVARYLLTATPYRVELVNPLLDRLFSQPVYPALDELPEPPDLVCVFRRREHLPGVAADAVAVGAGTLWLQLGLRHPDLARSVPEAGLQLVMDRCLKIEHARLLGRRR